MARKKTKLWGKNETPHCEIDCVEYVGRRKIPGHPNVIVIFHLTKRGGIELARREAQEKQENARIEREIKRGKYGVPILYLLDTFGSFGF